MYDQFGTEIQSPVQEIQSNGGAEFGTKVDISDDGRLLIVGASNFGFPSDSNSTQTDTHTGAGAVFVYRRDSHDETWLLHSSIAGKENESLGSHFSLSPNGDWLAIRRGDFRVELYTTSDGNKVDDLVLKETVEDCMGEELELSNFWLALGCDRFERNRGKVQIFQLQGTNWRYWTEILGDNEGDRFGFSLALDAETMQVPLQTAIAAPNAHENRGFIRTFQITSSSSSNYRILGQDLIGDPDEKLGFSIAFSNSLLVAGSPSALDTRGKVLLWELNEREDWTLVGEFQGNENDRFGRSVAMSQDGRKIAASSLHHNNFAGMVQVYERISASNFSSFQTFHGADERVWFGNSIAMNGPGSLFVSGSERSLPSSNASQIGSVAVFLDRSPFCGKESENEEETFVSRNVCLDTNEQPVATPEQCRLILGAVGTKFSFCEWYEPPPASKAPSQSPTQSPSIAFDTTVGSSGTFSPSDHIHPTWTPAAVDTPTSTPGTFIEERLAHGCACGDDGACTNYPIDSGNAFGLCIVAEQEELLDIADIALHQTSSSDSINVIADFAALRNGTTSHCSNKVCNVRIHVPDFMSTGLGGVGGIISVTGVATVRGNVGQENLVTFGFQFATRQPYEESDEIEEIPSVVWLVLFGGILLSVCLAAAILALRRRRKQTTQSSI